MLLLRLQAVLILFCFVVFCNFLLDKHDQRTRPACRDPRSCNRLPPSPTVSQAVAVSQANACVCRVPKSMCLISSFKQYHHRPFLDFEAFGVEEARTRCSDFRAWLGAPSPHSENNTNFSVALTFLRGRRIGGRRSVSPPACGGWGPQQA